MATKEQIAKLLADKPETIVARLSGTYIYPGAVSPMKQSPLCEEAAREIVRLRTERAQLRELVQQIMDTGTWSPELDDVVAFALVTGKLRENG